MFLFFRQFINEFCKTEISAENGWLNIDFIFEDDNVADLDPEITFKDKCRRFMNVFDITNLSDDIKIRFRSIGKLQTNQNIYELKFSRNSVKISINDKEVEISDYLQTKEVFS